MKKYKNQTPQRQKQKCEDEGNPKAHIQIPPGGNFFATALGNLDDRRKCLALENVLAIERTLNGCRFHRQQRTKRVLAHFRTVENQIQ